MQQFIFTNVYLVLGMEEVQMGVIATLVCHPELPTACATLFRMEEPTIIPYSDRAAGQRDSLHFVQGLRAQTRSKAGRTL